MAKLIEGFRHWLPDDFGEGEGLLGVPGGNDDGVVIWSGSDHDLGANVMSDEFREEMTRLTERGSRQS